MNGIGAMHFFRIK